MNANTTHRQSLFAKKVPLFYLILAVILTGILAYAKIASSSLYPTSVINSPKEIIHFPGVKMIRQKDYAFARPLILADFKEDPPEMEGLKSSIQLFINEKITEGVLENASVYMRKMGDGEYININANQPYNPGSTAKLSILITYLKESEKKPGLLNEELALAPGTYHPIKQFFPSEEIIANKKYSVKELLYYMIVKSSNSATGLLTAKINNEVFHKLFSDLDLTAADLSDSNYKLSAEEISRFMRVLYNASYLNAENSDYALSLLSKAEFNIGVLKGLPSGTKVSHKFGEQGSLEFRQLHETALVYYDDSAYIITVMTKGKDMNQLPDVLSAISRMVYNGITGNS